MHPMPHVPETWFSRDLPVLTSIVARVETMGSADQAGVVTDTGLDEVQVDRAVRALQDAGYLPQLRHLLRRGWLAAAGTIKAPALRRSPWDKGAAICEPARPCDLVAA